MRTPQKKRRLRSLLSDNPFADNLPTSSGLPVLTGYPIARRPRQR